MEDNTVKYRASSRDCKCCGLRGKCTSGKNGRTVRRHVRQDEVEHMRSMSRNWASKRDIKTRQHLMERSFAQAVGYGFKRSRWRGLWRMAIQEYMTAAVQNIFILSRHGAKLRPALALAAAQERCLPVKAVSGHQNAQEAGETTAWERCGRIKTAIIQAWRSIINKATLHLCVTLEANLV